MVFNFRKFLLYDVKLLTMGHGRNFKSTSPWDKSHSHRQICLSLSAAKCPIFICFQISFNLKLYHFPTLCVIQLLSYKSLFINYLWKYAAQGNNSVSFYDKLCPKMSISGPQLNTTTKKCILLFSKFIFDNIQLNKIAVASMPGFISSTNNQHFSQLFS